MNEQAGNAIADTREMTVVETPGSNTGQIRIHDDVISMIAHETARKVPGVVELAGSLVDGIANMIGKKDRGGIKVEKENDDLLSIDLTVVLEFGVCIPEICQQLQASVKSAVEEMTGKDIYAVNVFVAGIRCSKDKDGEE